MNREAKFVNYFKLCSVQWCLSAEAEEFGQTKPLANIDTASVISPASGVFQMRFFCKELKGALGPEAGADLFCQAHIIVRKVLSEFRSQSN